MLGGGTCGEDAFTGTDCDQRVYLRRHGHEATRSTGRTQHGRRRLQHGMGDGGRIAQRGLGRCEEAVRLLHLAVRLLLLGRVKRVQELAGLLWSKANGAALVLQRLAGTATCRKIGQTNSKFWQPNGALDRRYCGVSDCAADQPRLGRRWRLVRLPEVDAVEVEEGRHRRSSADVGGVALPGLVRPAQVRLGLLCALQGGAKALGVF